jgi:cupin 2 domain-containing protein
MAHFLSSSKYHIAMNIFQLPTSLPIATAPEVFETLHDSKNIKIERIISTGQVSESWYDQEQDEWVCLLQGKARLLFDHDQGETIKLSAGDTLFIPKHRLHRVVYTSVQPACIWLAIFWQ